MQILTLTFVTFLKTPIIHLAFLFKRGDFIIKHCQTLRVKRKEKGKCARFISLYHVIRFTRLFTHRCMSGSKLWLAQSLPPLSARDRTGIELGSNM